MKIRIWIFDSPLKFLACCIWNLSELIHFNLYGKFAPKVLGYLLNVKGEESDT